MRKILAIWITKILVFIGKLAGKKGSSTPGQFALKICPDLLEKLSADVRGNIIAVCGTNGKTTTNNLIYSMLKSCNKKIVCNNIGANMLYGVVTAFASEASLSGKLNADFACLEVDEISTIKVFERIKPDYVVITNLFRDQLDRYGEVDMTMGYLKEAITPLKNVKLVLNGDDPLLAALGQETGKECIYYGVDEDVGIALDEAKEGRFCRFCGEELEYDYYHYSQLGKYECKKCGFKRPLLKYGAKNVMMDKGIKFDVNESVIDVSYRGFYNIYNILASFAVLKEVGMPVDKINETLKNYKPQIGRMQTFEINNKQVIFNLAKNPAGFNQAISTVLCDKRKKDIIIAVNDKPSDGIDISWLWDVDYERLNDANCKRYYASGSRKEDLAVRFKYAGYSDFKVYEHIKDAIKEAVSNDNEVVYLLVNYTVLFDTEKILSEMEKNGI